MPNNSPASSRRSTTKPVVASGETRVVDPNQVSLLMPGSRNNSQSTAVPYAAGGSGKYTKLFVSENCNLSIYVSFTFQLALFQ